MQHRRDNFETYEYISALATSIYAFVAEKRGLGYTYNAEAKMLRQFDRFASEFGCEENMLSRELVDAYVAKRPGEAVKTQLHRISLMQQFGRYLARNEYEAFIPPPEYAEKGIPSFTPYIFSNEELNRFFTAADNVAPAYQSKYRYLTIPLLFRVLYGCGLRVNEALRLKCRDVDLDNGILSVWDSKFHRDRLVPMVPSLITRCREYSKRVHLFSDGESPFFPGRNGAKYDSRAVYDMFRDTLIYAGISHGGKGNGPRVHDLRHTFAVHSLRSWVLAGKNVYTLLPALSAYLGHVNLSSTSRYLRLTSDVFPDITDRMEKRYGSILPDWSKQI